MTQIYNFTMNHHPPGLASADSAPEYLEDFLAASGWSCISRAGTWAPTSKATNWQLELWLKKATFMHTVNISRYRKETIVVKSGTKTKCEGEGR